MAKGDKRRVIKLKCVKEVVVTHETHVAWFGWPKDNPTRPVLEWPKFAWKRV